MGRIGSITGSETPIAELSGSIMLNLTSFVALSEAFLAVHPQSHTTIVNITSLAAVTPFPSLSQYSMWKAAREMYLNCLALEASQDVKVLNYSPGPMATDMTAGFAANPLLDPNLGKQYDDYEQKVILVPICFPLAVLRLCAFF